MNNSGTKLSKYLRARQFTRIDQTDVRSVIANWFFNPYKRVLLTTGLYFQSQFHNASTGETEMS